MKSNITDPVNRETMDREVVERVAKISRINLTEQELDEFVKDLDDILQYFELLDSAPSVDGYSFNPIDITDVLRDDVPRSDIDPVALLKDMRTYEGYVRGPRII